MWYDKSEILIGDSLFKRIAEGLNGSEFIILVISSQTVESKWVKAELEPKMLEQIEGRDVTILPVVLGRVDPEKISLFLKGKYFIRFPYKGSDEKFRELLASIEKHLERRSLLKKAITIASPSLRNPFGLRGGVEPERFVTPVNLIRQVTDSIFNKQSVSIIGARMIGKTSLLKYLGSKRSQRYYQNGDGKTLDMRFVYVDLQEYSGKNHDQLLPVVGRAMSRLLSRREKFQADSHAGSLEWIKQTAGRKGEGDALWILSFDEFDRVVELNGVEKIFFDELRSLPQHYNLCFVTASRRKLIDLPLPRNVSTSPFFNIFKEHFLSVWDETTARNLIFRPVGKDLNIFTDEDYSFLTQLTASHPLLLQIACYHLLNARHSIGKKSVDYDVVRDNYMQEAESVYRYYLKNEIDEIKREWLNDCLKALTQKSENALKDLEKNTPDRKNRTIRLQLAKLGMVLNTSGKIKLPEGLRLFLS